MQSGPMPLPFRRILRFPAVGKEGLRFCFSNWLTRATFFGNAVAVLPPSFGPAFSILLPGLFVCVVCCGLCPRC